LVVYLNKMLADVNIGKEFLHEGTFLTQITDIGQLVSIIVSNAMILAGIILLFLIIAGGIGMIAGAGSNNPEQLEKGKKAITAAVIGFVIVFTAYWIVQLISKLTGVNILGQ
jgi:hypothetical protein